MTRIYQWRAIFIICASCSLKGNIANDFCKRIEFPTDLLNFTSAWTYVGSKQLSCMMAVDLPQDLHLQIRKIRNIEVWRSDLLPLIDGNKKLLSTLINAFGAQLQDSDHSDQYYTIFSSVLGAFASGIVHEGRAEGTFNEHIKAAVGLNWGVIIEC